MSKNSIEQNINGEEKLKEQAIAFSKDEWAKIIDALVGSQGESIDENHIQKLEKLIKKIELELK